MCTLNEIIHFHSGFKSDHENKDYIAKQKQDYTTTEWSRKKVHKV